MVKNKSNNKVKRLGKGLESIFGEGFSDVIKEVNTKIDLSNIKKSIEDIDLKKIIPNPYNPRKHFDPELLEELSKSIKENGLLTPIAVKPTSNGNYYIIAGERRYRASKLAGLKDIKAVILDVDDKKMQELALVENVQRSDLNPIEEAESIKLLLEKHNMTHEDVARVLGKNRSYVTNSLRLLNLDGRIRNFVLEGKLTYGHVRPLITLEPSKALEFAKAAIEKKWSVRNVENNVKFITLKSNKAIKKNTGEYEYVTELLRDKLRTKVEVTKNKIVIKFTGDDQLNRILERIDLKK